MGTAAIAVKTMAQVEHCALPSQIRHPLQLAPVGDADVAAFSLLQGLAQRTLRNDGHRQSPMLFSMPVIPTTGAQVRPVGRPVRPECPT